MDSTELRERMRELPPVTGDNAWSGRRSELRERVIEEGPENFLTWPVIVGAMWVGSAPWIHIERAALDRRLFDVTRDTNEIHMAYHIRRWEESTGKRIIDLDSIYEFGGGYGAMCALIHRLGFEGRYILCDFPEFLILQEYWLSSQGVAGVEFITPAQLRRIQHPDLFIGLWSLSEADARTRERIVRRMCPRSALIAHVGELPREPFAGLKWIEEPIRHLNGSLYLMGYSA